MIYERFKPLLSVLLLFIGVPVLGGVLAPAAFRVVGLFPEADFPFYRIWSRCLMLAAVLLAVPVCRLSGLGSLEALGLRRGSNEFRLFGIYAFGGVMSVLVLYGAGLWLGAFVWDPPGWTAGKYVFKLSSYLFGALFVGIGEEIFFRGFLFTALRRSCGLMTGLFAGALLFAAVHFIKPLNPPDVESLLAGFAVWGDIFGRVGEGVWQEFCSLFLMGLLLSLMRVRHGHLYGAMGLHFGWVASMAVLCKFLDSHHSSTFVIAMFGEKEWLSRGWLGCMLIGAFLVLKVCVQIIPLLKKEGADG